MPSKLKIMEIFTYLDEVECFEIAAPSLQNCTLWFDGRMGSCVIDMTKCPLLNYFNLMGNNLTDQQFHNIVSKFPLLENLRCVFVISLQMLQFQVID